MLPHSRISYRGLLLTGVNAARQKHAQPLLQREEGDWRSRRPGKFSTSAIKEGAELVIDARGSTPFVRGVGG